MYWAVQLAIQELFTPAWAQIHKIINVNVYRALRCFSHCSKGFTCINSFTDHNNPLT